MKISLPLMLALSIIIYSCTNKNIESGYISTETLLDELITLDRLSYLPPEGCRTVQFSSYDRRSISPSLPGWFSNSDGFGGEPVPGFLATITEPDSSGTGEYLICDIKSPGVIVRTWTAMINGELDVYIDNNAEPIYTGSAEKFFWNTASALDPEADSSLLESVFRQNDACYFPVLFKKGCRIVWRGDLNGLHFYHLQVRLFDDDARVVGFNKADIRDNIDIINKITDVFNDPGTGVKDELEATKRRVTVPSGGTMLIDTLAGPARITGLAFRAHADDLNEALRKNVLKIYFDGASVPQVNSPLGDFFGTAPGLNPYNSLPFSVEEDGTMICYFPMPFKNTARIIIENHSEMNFQLEYSSVVDDYEWIKDRSMHFRAKWRISHNLTASNEKVQDLPYLMARGRGRFVGVTAFIKNPSRVPSSWGNWWGEGDEKIWVDNDTFPSVFGTGSEDYFNYSWSSPALFDHMYCGQPRNDGPANRGFVTNYRYQVVDDIVFNSFFAFFMELFHHGEVDRFDYGRICYYYATPETIDDHMMISDADLRTQYMPVWEKPVSYLGSGGYDFIEAERSSSLYPADRLFYDYLWSGGRAFFNTFSRQSEKFELRLYFNKRIEKNIQLTMAHTPESGKVRIYIKGMEEETAVTVDLHTSYGVQSRNHSLKNAVMEPGHYSIVVENLEEGPNRVGVDFLWLPT